MSGRRLQHAASLFVLLSMPVTPLRAGGTWELKQWTWVPGASMTSSDGRWALQELIGQPFGLQTQNATRPVAGARPVLGVAEGFRLGASPPASLFRDGFEP